MEIGHSELEVTTNLDQVVRHLLIGGCKINFTEIWEPPTK